MFIALISTVMVLLGAALIIRPKERTAPQPWEMGTKEVEMEEELTREAMGISEEDIGYSSSLGGGNSVATVQEPDSSAQPEIPDIPEGNWENDPMVGELLEPEAEDIDLEDLNVLADGLDEETDEDEDQKEEIDTSFLDDIL